MFIIKVLFENFKVKPSFKDNKVISLIFHSSNNDKIKVEMFDSYLILPSSLRTLAVKYKVVDLKGFFPYGFVNEMNLDYIGKTPDISLFNGISAEEYEGLISYTWNLKAELLRYENKPIAGFSDLCGKDEYLDFMLECDSKNISVNQSLPSAIAVTAYARMYMFKVIYQLLELGIDIYYMDTDSIVVNKALPSLIP
uniref:Probable DNA polymerase n=1 Tax=Lactarius trivialis TaxID=217427 RepID=A0A891ZRJ8_9AGAM|nr:hypothetical protein K8L25_mgp11 [Lactarius trivialis]QRN74281.1 hypothetical protein [Lactarius trivialis]